jgi:hypothetical protein
MLRDVMNNASKAVAEDDSEERSKILKELFVGSLLLVVVWLGLMLFGSYLWNNFARRLVPGLGVARWYDVFVLSILLSLLGI